MSDFCVAVGDDEFGHMLDKAGPDIFEARGEVTK